MTPAQIDQRAALADAEAEYWEMLAYNVQARDGSGSWQEAEALIDRVQRDAGGSR
jgi:hypothetical protein